MCSIEHKTCIINRHLNVKNDKLASVETNTNLSEVHRCYVDKYEKGAHMPVKASFKTLQSNTVMILPQVHLRKPCYDFYFL